jgi:hypothetical protein
LGAKDGYSTARIRRSIEKDSNELWQGDISTCVTHLS